MGSKASSSARVDGADTAADDRAASGQAPSPAQAALAASQLYFQNYAHRGVTNRRTLRQAEALAPTPGSPAGAPPSLTPSPAASSSPASSPTPAIPSNPPSSSPAQTNAAPPVVLIETPVLPASPGTASPGVVPAPSPSRSSDANAPSASTSPSPSPAAAVMRGIDSSTPLRGAAPAPAPQPGQVESPAAAPSAAGQTSGSSNVPADLDRSKFTDLRMELLVSGPDVVPFSADDEANLRTAIDKTLTGYTHYITFDGYQVNITITAPNEQLQQVTQTIQDAIASGQLQSSLNETGLPVNVALLLVTVVNQPSPSPSPPSPVVNNAPPVAPPASGSSISPAVIGGAVGGAAALAVLAMLVGFKYYSSRRARIGGDLEAIADGKHHSYDSSSSDERQDRHLTGAKPAYFPWTPMAAADMRNKTEGGIQVQTVAAHQHNGQFIPTAALDSPASARDYMGTIRENASLHHNGQMLALTGSGPQGPWNHLIDSHGSHDLLLFSGGSANTPSAGNGSPTGSNRPPLSPMSELAAHRPGHNSGMQHDAHNRALVRAISGDSAHVMGRHGSAGDEEEHRTERQSSMPRAMSSGRLMATELWQVNWRDLNIQKVIGEGSFGKVYLAKWRETTVAVKVLTSPLGTDDEEEQRNQPHPLLESLEKEAGIMATMRHPNVVMYLGVCPSPPSVVTEYCARGSLNDVLKRARSVPSLAVQLDWARRLNMVLDAAKGMNYLHSSDPPVIHRDLKSPNLLVDKHWRVKVCDFNLSRVMEEAVVLSSMAASNPRWLAPEILSGRGYTFSSDVYSFGIIMWEFLTWRVPWHECGPWQVVALVTEGQQRPEIPPIEALPSRGFPGLNDYLALMKHCWAQDPEERPTFAHAIARAEAAELSRNEPVRDETQ
ncbi:hypothetical protein WJX72_011709 [[Myrmecia] bisecta]|uniref:Protein kinase domain-containing protein n=1 Tax=[Myrmecia] bisecta TaxID=41462 RepID=A0AAW1RA47_9CHLO